MNRKIRTVIVGHGFMGKNHERVLSCNPHFEVVAIVDPNVEQGTSTRPFFKSLTQAIAEIDFELAVVSAPSVLHFEISKQLLHAGKDLLIEKPMCLSADEAVELDCLAHKLGRKLAVAHVERANPAVTCCREILAQEFLGRIIHADFTRVGGYPKLEQHTGNVIIDLAIHDIDLFLHFFGKADVKAAVTHSVLNKEIKDTAELMLLSESGVTASLHANWITPCKIRQLTITGELGVCFIDFILQTVRVVGGKVPIERTYPKEDYVSVVESYRQTNTLDIAVANEEPLKVQAREIYKFLSGQSSACTTALEAIEAIKLADHALVLSEE